jgi:uncharacterized protein YpmB
MERKSEHIRVYFTPRDKQKVKKKAKEEGLEPSSWMRMIAKKELPQEVEA